MTNLIIKDILVQKRTVMFSLIYIFFIIFAFQKMGAAMFPTGITAFIYMLTMTSCAHDEKNKSDILINSLPVRRLDVVLAKYLSVVMFFIMGVIAYVILTGIADVLGLPVKVFPVTLGGLVGAALAVSLTSGIYFPIFFKVGYIRARVINFLLFFGVFSGTVTFAEVVYKNKESALARALNSFFSSTPDSIIVISVIAVIIFILAVSFSLSVMFYKNREF